MVYYQIEPWGEKRADLRSGIIASILHNVNRGKKDKASSASDFIITTEVKGKKKSNKQSPEDQAKIARMLQASLGGVLKRKK